VLRGGRRGGPQAPVSLPQAASWAWLGTACGCHACNALCATHGQACRAQHAVVWPLPFMAASPAPRVAGALAWTSRRRCHLVSAAAASLPHAACPAL
jgi:hypothetical protein